MLIFKCGNDVFRDCVAHPRVRQQRLHGLLSRRPYRDPNKPSRSETERDTEVGNIDNLNSRDGQMLLNFD